MIIRVASIGLGAAGRQGPKPAGGTWGMFADVLWRRGPLFKRRSRMATWIIITAAIGIATFFGWLLWRVRKSFLTLIALLPIASVVWVIAGMWFWSAITQPAVDTIVWNDGGVGIAIGFSLAAGLVVGLPLGLLLVFIASVMFAVSWSARAPQDKELP
jgi:hypothetical protein